MGSQFTWQAFAAVNYELRSNMHISAGYRHVAINYHQSGRHLNVDMGGPVVGFSYQF